MNHTGKPLAGVRLSIASTNLSATSDNSGKFEFSDQVPPGKIDLFVDGRTVNPSLRPTLNSQPCTLKPRLFPAKTINWCHDRRIEALGFDVEEACRQARH
jgi:hypothetical protein